uniref:START domain-containing protein n=1 Tax=Hyaloperonospora arabidopsidis (strain Emoy2) TaxID=559515 RepID=M4BLQ7_HYAAE
MASALHNQQKHKKEIRNISPSGGKKLQTLTKDGGMEDKRARRSAIEKKSRQRRQRVLKTMRDEVQQLETLYRTMVEKQKSTSLTTGGHSYWKNEEIRGKSQLLASARASTFYVDELALQKKYAELSVVAQTLEDDRRMLQQLLRPHQEFHETVESGFADENKRGEEAELEVWDTGVPPSLSFQAEFTKLTTAECYALVRESYEAIQRFQQTEHFKSTGANFMGWTDKRKYDESSGTLQYGFTKRFPLETAEGLLLKTWGIITDAQKFKDMSFDRSVRFRYQVLQQMNDDLVIIRRDHRIPNIDTTFASVQVLFRMQTPTGFTLCMRAIPSPEILRVQDAHEYFYDCFHWTHFNHMYDEAGNIAGCELMTAGSIADQSRLKSSYWLFEIVCSTLRWESACVAPLFLKQT